MEFGDFSMLFWRLLGDLGTFGDILRGTDGVVQIRRETGRGRFGGNSAIVFF